MINEQEINTRNLHISQTDKLVAAVIIINNTREITIIITVNLVIIGDNIYIYNNLREMVVDDQVPV